MRGILADPAAERLNPRTAAVPAPVVVAPREGAVSARHLATVRYRERAVSGLDAVPEVRDETDNGRLVLTEDGVTAELDYAVEDGLLMLLHTEVPEGLRGHGIAAALVAAAVAKAGAGELTVVPWCPYARRWLQEHPDAAGTVTVDFTVPPPDRAG
jgi:predicted GNAT family acetyltransferase